MENVTTIIAKTEDTPIKKHQGWAGKHFITSQNAGEVRNSKCRLYATQLAESLGEWKRLFFLIHRPIQASMRKYKEWNNELRYLSVNLAFSYALYRKDMFDTNTPKEWKDSAQFTWMLQRCAEIKEKHALKEQQSKIADIVIASLKEHVIDDTLRAKLMDSIAKGIKTSGL